MTRRHPFGGSTYKSARLTLVLGACVALAAALTGCGGSGDDYYYPDPGPRYHEVNIVLNVSDLAGNAVGEVVVWVNGVAQTGMTSWNFAMLGNNYPPELRGFLANWIQPGFSVATYSPGDYDTIEVMVTKPGYYPQSTTFTITDNLPADVYARETFVMERSPYPNTAEAKPRVKDKPGEVIGWDKKTSKLPEQLGPMYKLAAWHTEGRTG